MVTYLFSVVGDRVFKALADPTRRHLLDLLFERDGRSLSELEPEAEMTRLGVMKHLRALEEAGLVVSRRSGREKPHFLNKATPQAIWEAIIKPEFTARYFFGAQIETTAQVGSPFRYHSPDASSLWGDETVLESDPPRRLIVTWHSLYEPALAAEPPSRVSWEIEPQDGDVCKLTVIHDQLDGAPKTAANVAGPGWMLVLSGLKTLLETGAPRKGA